MGIYAGSQTTTALYGTVTGKTGAVVPNAAVTATNAGTNQARTIQTNAEGEYRLDFLPIGDYSLEVSAQGFKKFCKRASRCRSVSFSGPMPRSTSGARPRRSTSTLQRRW